MVAALVPGASPSSLLAEAAPWQGSRWLLRVPGFGEGVEKALARFARWCYAHTVIAGWLCKVLHGSQALPRGASRT